MMRSGPKDNVPAPPPPPGQKAPPSLRVTDLKDSERTAWINSSDGLNITKLKVAYYPKDEALLKALNTASSNGGKLLPEDSNFQNKVRTHLQEALKAHLTTLFAIAATSPDLALPLLKRIDDKVKNWKNGSSGLNDFFELLNEEVPKLQISAKKSKAQVDVSNDKEYQKYKKQMAKIEKEYQILYQKYQEAHSDKQTDIFERLKAVVQKIDTQRFNIQSFKSSLEDSKLKLKQLEVQANAPLKAKQDAIQKMRHKIHILKNPSGYTDPDTQAENHKMIAQLERDIQKIEQKKVGSEAERVANQKALNNAHKIVEANEAKVTKAAVYMAIFSPPDSWKEIIKAERKKEQKGTKREKSTFDTKGMYLGEKNDAPANQRKFDVRFLDPNQLSRLARFFSHEAGEFTISDNNSLHELMATINGVLGLNEQVNFDVLMDIAEGRMKRKPGTFADYRTMHFLNEDTIDIDSNRKPDYDKLLARGQSYGDVEKNKQRGLTIGKTGKYNERQRSIDLDYFTEAQMAKLQRFFANSPNDLLQAGAVDRKAVNERINDLLNRSHLIFEDIFDIAEGHLVRKNQRASNEHFTLMLEGVERLGHAPDYETAVKQRADYIAEQARLRQAALEKKRRQQAADKEQSLAEVQEQAEVFIQTAKEQFEKPFKKRIAEYAIDMNDLDEFQLFAEHVEIELMQKGRGEVVKEAIFSKLRQMNPAVVLDINLQPNNHAPNEIPAVIDKVKSVQETKLQFPHDETALRVVRNILAGIDIKTRYKKADVHKTSPLASYKMFQNKDRAEQIKALDKAVSKAKQAMLNNPESAFESLQTVIKEIKTQLEKEKGSGKRKLGDSRLEKVVADLSKEVNAMQHALHATTVQTTYRPPKLSGG
jgi:hypothetical protein